MWLKENKDNLRTIICKILVAKRNKILVAKRNKPDVTQRKQGQFKNDNLQIKFWLLKATKFWLLNATNLIEMKAKYSGSRHNAK